MPVTRLKSGASTYTNPGTVVFPEGTLTRSGRVVTYTPAEGGGDASGIQVINAQLTNAQIKALPTFPNYVPLLPAPGAGLINVLVAPIYLLVDTTAGAYTNIHGASRILAVYGDGWDVDLSVDARPSAILALGAVSASMLPVPRLATEDGFAVTAEPWAAAQLINTPIVLAAVNSLGNFTGGHASNTLSVRVWYATVPAVPFGA